MDAASRSVCLSGTRSELLDSIVTWAINSPGDKNVFWLHGPAGCGKSTIATTIAEFFRELSLLGAFLFFSKDAQDRSDPSNVIRTLAYQLAFFDSHIGTAISAVITTVPSIAEASLRVQFHKLLLEPVAKLVELGTHGPVVIVIDALDECGTISSRKPLLTLLSEELSNFPPVFRIIITSRAEFDVQGAFQSRSNILAHDLGVDDTSNRFDIELYLRHSMAEVRKANAFAVDPYWPGDEAIHQLADRSAGLFVWAKVAVKFIASGIDPNERLNILLDHQSHHENALDGLYSTALASVGNWDDNSFVSDFQSVMGILLASRRPVTDKEIDGLRGLESSRPSVHVIARLGSLLDFGRNQAVRVLHWSLVDYLSNPERCGHREWFIDLSKYNRVLAMQSLSLLQRHLARNICRTTLYSPPDRWCGGLPGDLAYACTFWIDHLCAVREETAAFQQPVEDFSTQHLLHWFEAVSVLGETGSLPGKLTNLCGWTTAGHLITSSAYILTDSLRPTFLMATS
jgi:hypothetical protein